MKSGTPYCAVTVTLLDTPPKVRVPLILSTKIITRRIGITDRGSLTLDGKSKMVGKTGLRSGYNLIPHFYNMDC